MGKLRCLLQFIFSVMDPEVPEWLDAGFLEVALQGGETRAPPATVTRFSACPTVTAGKNYQSRLYRVHVEYKRDGADLTTSLIIKVPLTKGFIAAITDVTSFYSREPNVYRILPLMNELIGRDFGPKLFHVTESNTIVMSDLKLQGFENQECQYHQLDFAHCEQVLITLAQFHATSIKIETVNPKLISGVMQEVVLANSDSRLITIFENSLKTVVKIAEENNFDADAVHFLTSRVQTIGDTAVKLCKPKPTGLNVLNHGDLWCNNILFKHSRDRVDVRFVDFQISRYASPALDLIYFIWTSADNGTRESRIPELCEIYRHNLNSSLEILGCEERMTKEELQNDLRVCMDWGVITICFVLPITATDSDVVDFENLTSESDDKLDNLKNSTNYRTLLPKQLKHFLNWIVDLLGS